MPRTLDAIAEQLDPGSEEEPMEWPSFCDACDGPCEEVYGDASPGDTPPLTATLAEVAA